MRTRDEIRENGSVDELDKLALLEETEADISVAIYLGSLPAESIDALKGTARDLCSELDLA